MMSGTYAPLGTGTGLTPVELSDTLGATFLSISAMASMAFRMPLPMAVLRPVARLLIAAISESLSVVGGLINSAKPEKATIPIRVVDFCCWMNEIAAFSAASIRLGLMSVEHMLRDTS